ncbi:glycosyltransferase family 2 protein [Cystobasidium minutum MCA 4210]|uniref:glycosyltransferase family 2 protein n=1 Tax=Cystobasidium minutum MCA 4210 TaxID=1397322 RepID=UPI0034CF5010|eukprot:jgi/Rhomi1/140387/e_gw1.2.1273.1
MLYLTSDRLPILLPLGIIGFYRYLWYLIRFVAFLAYKPIPIPDYPTYRAEEDVTIIVPTIDAEDGFLEASQTWLVGNPKEIIIVTAEHMREALEEFAVKMDGDNGRVRVITVPQANKRRQMAEGIKATQTDIIVFADDDALWPPTLLQYVLACFEDQSIGGVGTSQVVKPVGKRMTVWEVLAAMRLSIRNIEIAASTHIDGGIPCLSGRTAAYRSVILKDPDFIDGFTNDYWLGKYHLNSGDDKFLTRWLVSHGWNTYVQCCPGAELQSTMKPNWRFLKQVLRWTRNTWRSDLRSIFIERHIWTRHPYVAYMMIDKFLNPLTLLAGPCLVFYLCIKSGRDDSIDGYRLPAWNVLLSWVGWLLLTRGLKLAPHFYHRPQDIIYIPAWLLFGYYFAVMKIYSLLTLHEVGWGTRALGNAAPATDITTATAPSINISHTRTASDEKVTYINDDKYAPHSRQHEDEKASLRTSVRRRLNRSPAPATTDHYTSHLSSSKYEEEQEREQRYRNGASHYKVKDEPEDAYRYQYRRRHEAEEEEEEDLGHGLQIYHDYLPQLRRTPDLESAKKPVIRMR